MKEQELMSDREFFMQQIVDRLNRFYLNGRINVRANLYVDHENGNFFIYLKAYGIMAKVGIPMTEVEVKYPIDACCERVAKGLQDSILSLFFEKWSVQ